MLSTDQRYPPAGLSRRQAIPLAVGPIAESGILFLPSAVYAEAGDATPVVWLVATGRCLVWCNGHARHSPDRSRAGRRGDVRPRNRQTANRLNVFSERIAEPPALGSSEPAVSQPAGPPRPTSRADSVPSRRQRQLRHSNPRNEGRRPCT